MLPHGQAWQACAVEALGAVDQQLWRLLGGGRAVWTNDTGAHTEAVQWRAVLIDDAPDSQFDDLLGALKQGLDLPDKLIGLALAGSRFRGQRNRPWTALRGNLHLTAYYRLAAEAAPIETGLIMLPVVAAARTIIEASAGRLQPRIKWVNDILIDGQKVAGVLTASQVEGSTMHGVVLGIGMNVDHRPNLAPTPFVPRAAALAEFDAPLRGGLPRIFHTLVRHLDEELESLLRDGPETLYHAYRSLSDVVGREVRIWPEPRHAGEGGDYPAGTSPIAQGVVRELLPDLSLVIDAADQPVRKGRMELVR